MMNGDHFNRIKSKTKEGPPYKKLKIANSDDKNYAKF